MPQSSPRLRWTEEQRSRLIAVAKNYDVLWRASNSPHFNRLRREALTSVHSHFAQEGFSFDDVRQQLRNLKDIFFKRYEKSLIRAKKGEPPWRVRPCWVHFEELKFLANQKARGSRFRRCLASGSLEFMETQIGEECNDGQERNRMGASGGQEQMCDSEFEEEYDEESPENEDEEEGGKEEEMVEGGRGELGAEEGNLGSFHRFFVNSAGVFSGNKSGEEVENEFLQNLQNRVKREVVEREEVMAAVVVEEGEGEKCEGRSQNEKRLFEDCSSHQIEQLSNPTQRSGLKLCVEQPRKIATDVDPLSNILKFPFDVASNSRNFSAHLTENTDELVGNLCGRLSFPFTKEKNHPEMLKIWNFFTIDDNRVVFCRADGCGFRTEFSPRAPTTNLVTHLKSAHPNLFEKFCRESQQRVPHKKQRRQQQIHAKSNEINNAQWVKSLKTQQNCRPSSSSFFPSSSSSSYPYSSSNQTEKLVQQSRNGFLLPNDGVKRAEDNYKYFGAFVESAVRDLHQQSPELARQLVRSIYSSVSAHQMEAFAGIL